MWPEEKSGAEISPVKVAWNSPVVEYTSLANRNHALATDLTEELFLAVGTSPYQVNERKEPAPYPFELRELELRGLAIQEILKGSGH